jgi:regulator of sigma E protease
MSIVYFIIVLFIIVLVHEWGHYKTAKLFGVRVDEFGFGYPPKIFTLFKRGETTFTLNALPFGGFVKIFGEDSTSTGDDVSRALYTKPKWQQAIILVAGVVMNILLAWVIFLFLFIFNSPVIGSFVPEEYVTNKKVIITQVQKNSSADAAGLRQGDIIRAVKTSDQEGVSVSSPNMFTTYLQTTNGENINTTILRDGKEIDVSVTPLQQEKNAPYKIGVGLNVTGDVQLPIGKAVILSMQATGYIIGSIFLGLFELIKGLFGFATSTTIEVSGPVGIVKTIGDASQHGFQYILSLTALISLNLAVLNILPIPALDGGRLLFLLIEKIICRPINLKTATIIHTTSFLILVCLMLLVTVFDVFKLIK